MKRFKVRNDIQARDAFGRFAGVAGRLGRSPKLGIKSRVGRAALLGGGVGGLLGLSAGSTAAVKLIQRMRKNKKNKGLTTKQKLTGLGVLGAGFVGGDLVGTQIGRRTAGVAVRTAPRLRSLAKKAARAAAGKTAKNTRPIGKGIYKTVQVASRVVK